MKNRIGYRMKIARAMKKPPWSQMDLLARIQLLGWDITQSTLSKIEHADRAVSDGELVLIAKALEVDILWLLGERQEKL